MREFIWARRAPIIVLAFLAILLIAFAPKALPALLFGMALVGNTADRNADRDRFVAAFPATALLQFWSGSAPAATAAATGTKVAEITLPATPWDTATNGQAIKQGTWTTTTTLAGTPGYFRFVNAAGTVIRQGVVGTDATAAAVATNGDTYTVTAATLTFA